MSSNPNQDRLRQLFEPPEEEDINLRIPQSSGGGWSWTCNAEGNYLFCSAGVRENLEIEADRFVGQPLASFQVHPDSIALIQQCLQKEDFPQEVNILMGSSAGTWIPIRMHIFSYPREQGTSNGWYGFNLLIRTPTESTQRDEIDRAVLLIRQGQPIEARRLLRSIIHAHPEDEGAWLWLASTFDDDTRRLQILEDYLAQYPTSKIVRQVVSGMRGRVLRQSTEKARLAAMEILASEKEEEPVPTRQTTPSRKNGKDNQSPSPLVWTLLIIGATILAAVLYVFLR